MSVETVEKFISELEKSLPKETFVKLTLGNYRGTDTHLQKILARLVKTKKGTRLFFLYRFNERDTAKNFDFTEGVAKIRESLGTEFFSGHLFTTENDFQLDIGRKGKSRLYVGKPTFRQKPSLAHNREKEVLVNPDNFYLRALGITTEKGEIRAKQHDKWKQTNKFVEILSNLFDNSLIRDKRQVSIVDMGAGKGYLTFAAYDYFKNTRGIDVKLTGVDTKAEIVALCNDIARKSEFDDLQFVHGFIGDYRLEKTDVLIALHACNTATDDAIFKGISANASLIVCAPCCHQEIRPQIKPPAFLRGILKHGVMLEREAETLTDGLRALLLERSGYAARIFEFVSTEHTPKNNMIVGTRRENLVKTEKFDREIADIKNFYGIEKQHLERLLTL